MYPRQTQVFRIAKPAHTALFRWDHLLAALCLSLLIVSPVLADWPCWLGPNYNHTIEYDGRLVDDPAEIELVWKSQFNTGNAANHKEGNYRGCASPVVSDGFLYHYYFLGNDDGIICIDTRNGKTKWNRVFAGKGKTWTGHKNNLNNNSPVVSDGKVFALGSKFRLYCVKASDGSVVWESTKHPHYGQTGRKSRQCNGALIVAGGVLIVPENAPRGSGYDRAMDIYGFSMRDGAMLWKADNVLGDLATPTCVTLDGKAYVLAANGLGKLSLIDPSDGSIRWQKKGLGPNEYTIVTSGDRAFCNVSGGQLGCFRLTERGATLEWKLPASYGFPPNKQGVLPDGDNVFIRFKSRWVAARMSDGKVLGEFRYEVGNDDEAYMLRVGNRILNEFDSQHGKQQLGVLNTDPNAFKPLFVWNSPHKATTSYSVPICHPFSDGRMFIRGLDGIYCYDLRKFPDGRPRAHFTVDATRGGVPFTVNFDASQACDDIAIVRYEWDFGDGQTGTGKQVSHVYKQPGTYAPKLTVFDNDGKNHSFALSIHAVAGPPAAPSQLASRPAGSTRTRLTWKDTSDDELNFLIERRQGNRAWRQVARVKPNTQTHIDHGLKAGREYVYRVRAWNGAHSAYSSEAGARTHVKDYSVQFEPEKADHDNDVYEVVSDPRAKNGKYIMARVSGTDPQDAKSILSFPFNAPFEGSYRIWGRGSSPAGGGADSYWLQIDKKGWLRLDINIYSNQWGWRLAGEMWLEAGAHTLHVAPRDKGCRLDHLHITTSERTP